MGIRLDPEHTDAQGLPVVTWEEDRDHFAPDGLGPARVACFIRPDKDTGVLQFVSVGSVRHGAFEEARPWARLVSFGSGIADQLYQTAEKRALLEMLASKSKSGAGRVLTTDGARVMLANFADQSPSVPMHLNCASASATDAALLHDRLHREFIVKRADLLHEICDGEAVWPKNRAFVAFEPPARPHVPLWMGWTMDVVIWAVVALIAYEIYRHAFS